jgi:uncharacterized protein YndB with AHSA1/START domain
MITTERDRPGLERATGRDYDEWFGMLDEWGALGRPFREIADWLQGVHGVSRWWAQKLIVEYEQARGLRQAGARPGGTIAVGTSKTIDVPVERLYDAVVDPRQRQRWLPGVTLGERSSQPGRSARFDLPADGTRVSFTCEARGDTKSVLAVEHERLADPQAAEQAKAFWRERLTALKNELEGNDHE